MTYLTLRMEIEGNSLPTQQELDLRWEIADLIEARQIGKVIGSGGGCGKMDIGLEVADVETARLKLRTIAEQYELKNFSID